MIPDEFYIRRDYNNHKILNDYANSRSKNNYYSTNGCFEYRKKENKICLVPTPLRIGTEITDPEMFILFCEIKLNSNDPRCVLY